MTILVVAPPDDVHARAVRGELERRGRRTAQLDFAAALEQPARAELGPGEPLAAEVAGVRFADVEAVWLRKVGWPRAAQCLAGDAARFAQGEAYALWRTLASALRHARWVNHPAALASADGGAGKLAQLEAARRLGLEIPRTLATNVEAEARVFVAANRERGAETIYKPFESPRREDRRAIFTQVVLEDDARLGGVAVAPCIFQERVPKRADVRVLVAGDRVLAAEIGSQAHPDSAVDFRRRYALGETEYRVHVLPPAVEAALVAVHRDLGLASGAADLVHTPDGRHVFLETNPSGAWLWLEGQLPELRCVEAFADLLEGR